MEYMFYSTGSMVKARNYDALSGDRNLETSNKLALSCFI